MTRLYAARTGFLSFHCPAWERVGSRVMVGSVARPGVKPASDADPATTPAAGARVKFGFGRTPPSRPGTPCEGPCQLRIPRREACTMTWPCVGAFAKE